MLVGERHFASLRGGTEPIEIPADRYTLNSYSQTVGEETKFMLK